MEDITPRAHGESGPVASNHVPLDQSYQMAASSNLCPTRAGEIERAPESRQRIRTYCVIDWGYVE